MNQTHILIAGGQTNDAEESSQAWLVHVEMGYAVRLPDMSEPRLSPACIQTESGEVVVAGMWVYSVIVSLNPRLLE